MRTLPTYETPADTICGECKQPCKIVGLRNEFDYAGTHCSFGNTGTHYPSGYGDPVSDCCDADILDAEIYAERIEEARDTVDLAIVWESIGVDAIPGKVGSLGFRVDSETLAMRILIAINTHDEAELGRLLMPMADKYIQDAAERVVK